MSVADNFTSVGSSPTGTMGGSMRRGGYGSGGGVVGGVVGGVGGGGGGGGGTVGYNLDGSLKTVMAEADSEQVLREQLTQLRELREEAEDQDAHIDRVERENASLRTCREGERRRTVVWRGVLCCVGMCDDSVDACEIPAAFCSLLHPPCSHALRPSSSFFPPSSLLLPSFFLLLKTCWTCAPASPCKRKGWCWQRRSWRTRRRRRGRTPSTTHR